jgi:hypothetical protein
MFDERFHLLLLDHRALLDVPVVLEHVVHAAVVFGSLLHDAAEIVPHISNRNSPLGVAGVDPVGFLVSFR